MTDGQWRYLSQLIRALQEEGVKGSRIGEHVAELASHLEGTDKDPVEEFGSPHEMATALTGDEELMPRWARALPVRLFVISLAMVGAVLIVTAVFDDPAVVTLGSILYTIGLGGLIVVFRRVATMQLDGRSLTSMITLRSTVVLLLGSGVIAWARTSDMVVATMSRTTGVLVGGVLLAVGLGLSTLLDDKVRFPDHARDLSRLTRPMSRRPTTP